MKTNSRGFYFLIILAWTFLGTSLEKKSEFNNLFIHPAMFTGVEDSTGSEPQPAQSFFKIKLFISSATKKGSPEMRTDLSGVIPNDLSVAEAFGPQWPQQEKWKSFNRYDTVSTVTVNKGAFIEHGGVDFVQVDFRKGDPLATEGRVTVFGFVTKTGEIHGMNGEYPLRVPYVIDGSWHIAVHNPRMLSVMSATKVHPQIMGTITYDFTTGPDKFFKNGGIEIQPGLWGSIGGEGKSFLGYGNNVLDLYDFLVCHNLIVNGPILNTYNSSDADFDGDVDHYDEELIWNSIIAVSPVPWIDENRNELIIVQNQYDFILPTYTLTAGSFSSISDSTFSFDIYLLSTGSEDFNYAAGQYILNIDSAYNVKNIIMSDPMMQDLTSFTRVGNQIRLIIATRPGGNYQVSSVVPGSKVASFKVTYSTQSDAPTPVYWVNTPSNIPTLIYANIGGQGVEITTPNTHLYDGGLTAITSTNSEMIPSRYTLSQNYPNPFNPVTKIKFAIPQQGIVELKVFDILGKEVVTLINESNMTPGSYEIDFNGNNLSTGVYYYRLTSGEFVDTKKMILMK